MRIGIYGGTFDPIHKGHTKLLEALQGVFDRIFVVVAGCSPAKVNRPPLSSGEDRIALAKAATSRLKGVEVSDIEVRRAGPSYMIDTVRDFHARFPDTVLRLILSEEYLDALMTWKEAKELVQLAPPLFVCNEKGGREEGPFEKIFLSTLPISSTEVRRRIRAGESIDGMLDGSVIDLILEKRLYK